MTPNNNLQDGLPRRYTSDEVSSVELNESLADYVTLRLSKEVSELSRAAANLQPDAGKITQLLDGIGARLVSDIDEIRRALLARRPTIQHARSPERALHDLLDQAEQTFGIKTSTLIAGDRVNIDKDLAFDIAMIAMEAIDNAARYSSASSIRAGLVYSDSAILLMVEDDGSGFDAQLSHEPGHLGIIRMRERTFARGGSFELTSDEGWGTTIRVRLPLDQSRNMGTRPIRVMVVEPRPALRVGFGRLLTTGEKTIAVVAELPGGAAALAALATVTPDVVIVGLSLLEDAVELISQIHRTAPHIAIVTVTTPFTTNDLLERALSAGAVVYTDAHIDGATLINTVLAVARGTFASATMRALRPDLAGTVKTPLTSREREIRQLIEEGLGDRAIAEKLSLSIKTVEKHVSSILRKADARNRVQLLLETRPEANGWPGLFPKAE
jgi:DNA-binding NarL/FixJ family response regulator/two-component sensor histidine kinase